MRCQPRIPNARERRHIPAVLKTLPRQSRRFRGVVAALLPSLSGFVTSQSEAHFWKLGWTKEFVIFFSPPREFWTRKRKKKGKGNPKKATHARTHVVELSDELQHPDSTGRQSQTKRLFAHNTGWAGPYSHMAGRLQRYHRRVMVTKFSPFSFIRRGGKVAAFHSPPGPGRPVDGRPSPPVRTRRCHPRKQQTSTWAQREEPSPAPPPSAEVGAKGAEREDEVFKGFPMRGPGAFTGRGVSRERPRGGPPGL